MFFRVTLKDRNTVQQGARDCILVPRASILLVSGGDRSPPLTKRIEALGTRMARLVPKTAAKARQWRAQELCREFDKSVKMPTLKQPFECTYLVTRCFCVVFYSFLSYERSQFRSSGFSTADSLF